MPLPELATYFVGYSKGRHLLFVTEAAGAEPRGYGGRGAWFSSANYQVAVHQFRGAAAPPCPDV